MDQGGLSYWVGLLNGGTVSRQTVAQQVFQSAEHRGQEVDSYYATFFGRAADAGGRQYWVNALVSGVTEQNVQLAFLTSREYQVDNQSNDAFVQSLYYHILGRAPDPSGQAYWVNQLGGPQSGSLVFQDLASSIARRRNVARAFVMSAEGYRTVVDGFYASYLRRQADPSGENFFVNQLLNGLTESTAAASLLGSDEYFTNHPAP